MLGQNNGGQAIENRNFEDENQNLKNNSAVSIANITTLTVSGDAVLTADTVSSSKTTGTLVVTGGVGVSGQVTSDTIKVVAGTASSSKTTGALVVTGGVGVSGQVTSDTIKVVSGTASSSKTTGALIVTGGVGVSGQVTSDTVKVIATTDSSTKDTGALIVGGGVGVTGQVTAETMESIAGMTVGGAMALNGNTVVGDAASDTLTVTATILGASPLKFEGSTVDAFETILAVGNPTSESKTLTLPTETGTLLTEISAVSTAITGVGTLESLAVSGTTTIASASGFVNIARTGAATTVKGSLNVKELVTLDKNTASTDKTTGTLVVTGGVGVSGQVSSNMVQVTATLVVGGASTLRGNVVVEGTLTNKDGIEFLPAAKVTNLGAAQSVAVSSTNVNIGGVGQTSLAMIDPTATDFATTADADLEGINGFGRSVAISGEFAIVGSSVAHKAFIFKNTGGTWGTTSAFTLDQNNVDGSFGRSVAISSEFAIVGAEGAQKAFIFKNTGGTWGTTAAFNLDQNIGDTNFGYSVAISSEFAIVGAYGAKKAFIFKNTCGTWGTTAAFTLDQNNVDGNFGISVAISSEFAIVGANGAQKAFIFKNTGGTWGTTAAFNLDQNTDGGFGISVAISSEFAIVGANSAKKAFIFKNTGGAWGTTAAFNLVCIGTVCEWGGDTEFGISVAISSEFAVVGTNGEQAFIFKNTGGTWGTTAAFNLDQNTEDSTFGNNVAISSEFAIVGAHGANKAFIFKKPTRKISTISGATAGDFLVLSVAAGKKVSLVKGGNIKMGTTCKCIALDGDEGDTVSLLYDGTNWLITSKNIND